MIEIIRIVGRPANGSDRFLTDRSLAVCPSLKITIHGAYARIRTYFSILVGLIDRASAKDKSSAMKREKRRLHNRLHCISQRLLLREAMLRFIVSSRPPCREILATNYKSDASSKTDRFNRRRIVSIDNVPSKRVWKNAFARGAKRGLPRLRDLSKF